MKRVARFKSSIILSILLVILCNSIDAQTFNRKDFYSAMASGDLKTIDAQIGLLKAVDIAEKIAFEGALLMKKAGKENGAGKKLNLFKQGHKKLEEAISNDGENGEYRFLRLMIQEHAPGMLGYKDDLKKDSAYIRQSYKKLPADVQHAIADYSKQSKVLKPGDFNL
ncbi:MAG: hypothetical protein QM764_23300 [Chitinophagaceae bacterium]